MSMFSVMLDPCDGGTVKSHLPSSVEMNIENSLYEAYSELRFCAESCSLASCLILVAAASLLHF